MCVTHLSFFKIFQFFSKKATTQGCRRYLCISQENRKKMFSIFFQKRPRESSPSCRHLTFENVSDHAGMHGDICSFIEKIGKKFFQFFPKKDQEKVPLVAQA
jgi:hypothetical protein